MSCTPDDPDSPLFIEIETDDWLRHLPDLDPTVRRAAAATLDRVCPGLDEIGIAIRFSTDDAVQTLNRTWRDKDSPTNVLSFPALDVIAGTPPEAEFPGQPIALGDIILAYETCAREASDQNKPLAHHVSHLVIHGILHLLGYDHLDDVEAERMEALETLILAGLDIPDPYVDPEQGNRHGDRHV